MGSSFALVVSLAAFAALFVAAVTDLKVRLIPNGLVLAVFALGMAARLLSGEKMLWLSLLIAALVYVVGAVLTRYAVIGGGDTKMIAAVTVLVPPAVVPALLICIALAGGVLGLFYLAAGWLVRRNSGPAVMPDLSVPGACDFDQIVRLEVTRIRTNEPMPYGVAIFSGAVGLVLIGVLSCISATSCSP